MTPLKDYIQKCQSKTDMYDWTVQICDFFNESQICDIFSLHKFPYKIGYDYIYETLKSHNINKFKEKLLHYFRDDILDIYIENENKNYGVLLVKFKTANLNGFSNDKFKLFTRLINFFGYNKNLSQDNYWVIEADTPEKCNDECRKLFNYRFFHVSPKCYAESILRNGLRIKEKSDEGYRKYPKRIQLKGNNPKHKNELLEFVKQLKEQRKNDPKWKDVVVFMVDLRDSNFDVYRDHCYPKEDHCYFIYNNVHPSDIRKLYEL